LRHIALVLGSFHSIIDYLTSRSFFLVDGIFIFGLLIILSAFTLFLLKLFGFFDIKDSKTNEELAEADTDFYKKSINFAIIPKKKKKTS
jgi:hypothetical protein